MQTQCPHCRTVYEVSEQFVEALDARVRCSQCMTVFNARDSLLPVVESDDVYLVEDDDPLDDTIVIDSLLDVDESVDQTSAAPDGIDAIDADPAVEPGGAELSPVQAMPGLPPIVDRAMGDERGGVAEDEMPDLTSEIELPELDLPDLGFTLDDSPAGDGAGSVGDLPSGLAGIETQSPVTASGEAWPEPEPRADDSDTADAAAQESALIEPVVPVEQNDAVSMNAEREAPEMAAAEASAVEGPLAPTERLSLGVPEQAVPPPPPVADTAAEARVEPASEDRREPSDTFSPARDTDRDRTVPAADVEDIPIPDLLREQMIDEPGHSPRRRQWPWGIGALLLASAIGTQLVLWQWDTLETKPEVRPLLASVCKLTGCELAPLRDVTAIRLLQRSVYSHPNVQGALIISVSMINEAEFAQPYPTLAIRMTDRQGKAVAARDFAPDSYLPAAQHGAVMAPSAPTTITLEVLDPGRDARSYELDFL